MAGSVLSDFRTHLQYVILFHLASFWKQSGKCVSLCVCIYIMLLLLFPSLSCVLGVFGYFFLHLFLWKLFKTHLEKLMRQFVIYCCVVLFFVFFLGGGDSKPFEGNGDSERLWVGPLMGMAVIPPYMKLQNPSRDVTAQNSLVLICSCVFQDAGWLALGVMGQSSMLGWETL